MIDYPYRSIDLLKRIQPEIAEHMTRCLATTLFERLKLHCISSIEDMDDYAYVVEYLYGFGADNPKDYLDYKEINGVWATFDESARWLAQHDVLERYPLFKEIAHHYMFEIGLEIINIANLEYSIYAEPVMKKVRYIAKKLKIPGNILWGIVQEEFTEVQKCHIPMGINRMVTAGQEVPQSIKELSANIADKLTRCFASGLFLIYGIDVMTDRSSMPYLMFSQMLKLYYNDHPGKYLNYSDLDIALKDFSDTALELAILKVPERYEQYQRLASSLYQSCWKYADNILENIDVFDVERYCKTLQDIMGLAEFFANSLNIEHPQSLIDIWPVANFPVFGILNIDN